MADFPHTFEGFTTKRRNQSTLIDSGIRALKQGAMNNNAPSGTRNNRGHKPSVK